MAKFFLLGSLVTVGGLGVLGFYNSVFWILLGVVLPLVVLGLVDFFQVRQGVRRNFPLIGNLRYFFEFIRPELQQYFVEDNLSGRPVSRENRSIVYQRAKGDNQTVPFGTQRDAYASDFEWVDHSLNSTHVDPKTLRVTIGGPQCTQPYSSSVLNISAMSYGALSKAAISALNLGAKQGGFYHNTGEGGISPYHLLGGDIVWQIGTGYFGCRTADGKFSPEAFKERAHLEQVKMIEIKLSQGAKPGKGGVLPAAKVSPEVAAIRLVPMGKAVISPSFHSAFSGAKGLLEFVSSLRELSGGKPIGFKLCVGKKSEFEEICQAMIETGIKPDFITVDGAEGGTGAAPLEFVNSVGWPLNDGLSFVHNTLVKYDLRKDIKVIAAGKVFTAFHLISKIALGADVVNSARGMMLAIGCIQALKCNHNTCPVGVATTDPWLTRGLHVPTKKDRVERFQRETLVAVADVLGAMGYTTLSQVRKSDIHRRMPDGSVKNYEELYAGV